MIPPLLPPGAVSVRMAHKVVISHNLDDRRREQCRFPRSKRRRIREKWRKQARNWRSYRVPLAYWYGRTLICNDLAYAQLVGKVLS